MGEEERAENSVGFRHWYSKFLGTLYCKPEEKVHIFCPGTGAGHRAQAPYKCELIALTVILLKWYLQPVAALYCT